MDPTKADSGPGAKCSRSGRVHPIVGLTVRSAPAEWTPRNVRGRLYSRGEHSERVHLAAANRARPDKGNMGDLGLRT